MSEKWTDGPWRVGDPDEFGDIAIQPVLSQLAVAVMVNREIMRLAGRADEHAANARLIAAAPTYDARLKETTDLLERLLDKGLIGGTATLEVAACIASNRDTLAKARGEQQ